jgi:hypothetical protein
MFYHSTETDFLKYPVSLVSSQKTLIVQNELKLTLSSWATRCSIVSVTLRNCLSGAIILRTSHEKAIVQLSLFRDFLCRSIGIGAGNPFFILYL